MSAFTTPTSVTFGKSSPLAIICVPSRIRCRPSRKPVERLLVAAAAAHAVGIHSQARVVGKAGSHFRLELLRAEAAEADAGDSCTSGRRSARRFDNRSSGTSAVLFLR